MGDFKRLFEEKGTKEHPYPRSLQYEDRTIMLSDPFSVSNKDILFIAIESTNSPYVQGFSIGICDGYIKINGSTNPRRKRQNFLFWEDSNVLDIKNIEIQVFTTNDCVFFRNIWEEESENAQKITCAVGSGKWMKGRCNGSAMYSEEIPGGKRYFCNDGDLDDDFDDIVFTVRRVPSAPRSKKRTS